MALYVWLCMYEALLVIHNTICGCNTTIQYWFAYKNGYTYKMKFSFSICHIFVLVGFVKLLMVMEGGYLPKKLLKNIKKRKEKVLKKLMDQIQKANQKREATVNQFQVVMQLKKENSKMMNWINQI